MHRISLVVNKNTKQETCVHTKNKDPLQELKSVYDGNASKSRSCPFVHSFSNRSSSVCQTLWIKAILCCQLLLWCLCHISSSARKVFHIFVQTSYIQLSSAFLVLLWHVYFACKHHTKQLSVFKYGFCFCFLQISMHFSHQHVDFTYCNLERI